MNRYYVSIDVGLSVTANSKEEAEKEAYNIIGNLDNGEFDDYTIIGEPREMDTNIENKCFQCGKRDTGGSNDEMCPTCFTAWRDDYDRRHKQ